MSAVCVRMCVRARMRALVRARVRACLQVMVVGAVTMPTQDLAFMVAILICVTWILLGEPQAAKHCVLLVPLMRWGVINSPLPARSWWSVPPGHVLPWP